jgi:hypothetical protein
VNVTCRPPSRLAVTVEPFDRLTAAQRGELDQQVERMGEFLERSVELTIGPVTAGAHA